MELAIDQHLLLGLWESISIVIWDRMLSRREFLSGDFVKRGLVFHFESSSIR